GDVRLRLAPVAAERAVTAPAVDGVVPLAVGRKRVVPVVPGARVPIVHAIVVDVPDGIVGIPQLQMDVAQGNAAVEAAGAICGLTVLTRVIGSADRIVRLAEPAARELRAAVRVHTGCVPEDANEREENDDLRRFPDPGHG